MTKLYVIAAVTLAALVLVTAQILDRQKAAPSRPTDEVAQLEARVTALEGRVPDQAIAMTHVAYHFANLWFAAKERNWSLADFYLGEVRGDLKWAARVHPVRQGPGGEVDVAGIAESVDNTQLTALVQAIHKGRADQFARAYDDTLRACYACHEAIGKPYLRPQRPLAPEAQSIHFGMNGSLRRPPSAATAGRAVREK